MTIVRTLGPAFLCFYAASAQIISRPLNDNTLQETLQFEDQLESRPFVLESGENYRDMLTITAARNVGQFYQIRNQQQTKTQK